MDRLACIAGFWLYRSCTETVKKRRLGIRRRCFVFSRILAKQSKAKRSKAKQKFSERTRLRCRTTGLNDTKPTDGVFYSIVRIHEQSNHSLDCEGRKKKTRLQLLGL
jgi:hypothetical protein